MFAYQHQHGDKDLDIELLNERAAMLADVGDQVSLMKHDLADLLRGLRNTLSRTERRINHEPCRDRGKVLVHMENTPCCSIAVGPLALLCIVLVAIWEPLTHAQQDTGGVHVPLTVEQVVKNLEQSTRGRVHALHHFEGIRVYRLQYHGFFGDRDAEMVVRVAYQSPATKEFTVISQSGSKFIIDRIFKKLLESEKEALRPENQEPTTLNTENYVFGLAGYEETSKGARYVLSVLPKSKNKFLYRGKVWVDAVDFAVVRIEAEPAKSPSFWIKKSVIEHTYAKVNNFWLPAYSRTETAVRLSGRAVLSIEYKDYKITDADPLPTLGTQ